MYIDMNIDINYLPTALIRDGVCLRGYFTGVYVHRLICVHVCIPTPIQKRIHATKHVHINVHAYFYR